MNFEVPQDKEAREVLKNKAVEVRESGDLTASLEMLKEVEKWDDANKNTRGQIDVLGHLRIVYSRLADHEYVSDKKCEYRELALQSIEKALDLVQTVPESAIGQQAILKVHSASCGLDLAMELIDHAAKDKALANALKSVNEAILILPGSKAHKAWPANVKAKILAELGKIPEALNVLTTAQMWLYEGYDDEMKQGDQASVKLNVWLSGLMLTMASIYAKEKKPLLARHYATYVLTMAQSEKALGERAKEAKAILDKL